jgi:hypothetical protein
MFALYELVLRVDSQLIDDLNRFAPEYNEYMKFEATSF